MLYFLKHEKLFYLQLFYLPVYVWSVIFTSIWNMKGPTGCLRFVATPWNQWRAENLGHNVTMMNFCTFIQLLIMSVMRSTELNGWKCECAEHMYHSYKFCLTLALSLTVQLLSSLWVFICLSSQNASECTAIVHMLHTGCPGTGRLGGLLDDNQVL